MKPRLLIADDHELVRQGLRRLIEDHGAWEVAGEASDGRETVDLARALRPDLVVLDHAMPRLNGLEATRLIRAELPRTEVLVLTMYDTDALVREVLAAGARGYVLKSDAGKVLITAIEALLDRRPYLTARVSELVLDGYLHGGRAEPGGALSPRERQVLQLLAEGQATKDVAAELGISVKTAETHRTNLMRKLGAGSIADVVRYAVRNGIIVA